MRGASARSTTPGRRQRRTRTPSGAASRSRRYQSPGRQQRSTSAGRGSRSPGRSPRSPFREWRCEWCGDVAPQRYNGPSGPASLCRTCGVAFQASWRAPSFPPFLPSLSELNRCCRPVPVLCPAALLTGGWLSCQQEESQVEPRAVIVPTAGGCQRRDYGRRCCCGVDAGEGGCDEPRRAAAVRAVRAPHPPRSLCRPHLLKCMDGLPFLGILIVPLSAAAAGTHRSLPSQL